MKKYTIGQYKVEEDKEYMDYLEREKKEAHTHIYDDCFDNPNYQESMGGSKNEY